MRTSLVILSLTLNLNSWSIPSREDSYTKETGIKKAPLVHLRVFSIKRCTAGTFAVSLSFFSLEKNMTGDI